MPDWLAHRAASSPARVAVVAGSQTWTYATLDAEVTRVAHRLAELGVVPGDRIATLMRNGIGPVLLVHAVLRLRATVVPLNIRLSEPELAWQIGDAGPRILVTDDTCGPLAERSIREYPRVALVELARLITPRAGDSPHDRMTAANSELSLMHTADAVLAIIYTSGTTGQPKGAMLTVGNFWWSAIGSALNLGVHADDRWLACLPLFHVGGLSIVLRAAIYGITAVVHDEFDADRVNRAIDEEGITIVSLVAVMLQRMLDAHNDRAYAKTLRTVLTGGGPVPRPLLERAAALGVPVTQTYGLTEAASQVATLTPADAPRKLGSVGRPLYPNEVRIAGPHRQGASGEAGEILVRGPIVMAGYWGQAGQRDSAIVEGWLHTGDIGRVDADGFLYVLDRRDDLIISGGENIYPAEVESALLAFPGVAEAGVIGIADTEWGQRVAAIIRLDAGSPPDTDALRAHCRARLAAYKVPAEFRFVHTPLPRTASGKLKRSVLAEHAASSTAR